MYHIYGQVMLILILIKVQYLQIIFFSFRKSLNDQIHSSTDSHLNTIWKTLYAVSKVNVMNKNEKRTGKEQMRCDEYWKIRCDWITQRHMQTCKQIT